MKITAMSIETLKDLDSLTGQAKVLNWFMYQIGKTFITSDGVRVVLAHMNDISNDLGAPIVSVRRWLSFLIKKGYISRRKGPKGKILCNVYIVNPEYIIKGKLTSSEAYLQNGGKIGREPPTSTNPDIIWEGCREDHKLIYFNSIMSDCPACDAILQAERSFAKEQMGKEWGKPPTEWKNR